MNKKERKLLENIEKSVNFEGDFNKLQDKLIIDKSFCVKKRKRLSFNASISISFASLVIISAIIIPISLKNINDVKTNASNNEIIIESSQDSLEPEISMMPENISSSTEEISNEQTQTSTEDVLAPNEPTPEAPSMETSKDEVEESSEAFAPEVGESSEVIEMEPSEKESDTYDEPQAPGEKPEDDAQVAENYMFEGNNYKLSGKLNDTSILGELIGQIDGNNVYDYKGDQDNQYIIIQIDENYYVLTKQS